MQILSVRVLEGPNIYSFNPVLRVRLDTASYDNVASSDLPGFTQRLLKHLPGLAEHQCSRGRPGGFVERLQEGTYLPHIFEHTLLELQCMAGYQVSFGKARSAGRPRIYDVVAGFRNPEAALAAARVAEELLHALLGGFAYAVAPAVERIRKAGEAYELGPSTAAIFAAAVKRGIPVRRLGQDNLLVLGYGRKQRRVWATTTGLTSSIASDLACDKQLTKAILAQGGLIVPAGIVAVSEEEAVAALDALGGPVVVKPLCGNQGKGVTIGVKSPDEMRRAY
ncbi:MAG: cyanophycin synthetase, partial [Negativicutes bacterium]|nr:cyanophycin synthetase [Negativicutes bacterium]